MTYKKQILSGLLLLLLVASGCAKQSVTPVKPYPDGTILDKDGRPLWVPPSQKPPVSAPAPTSETPGSIPDVSQPDAPSVSTHLPPKQIGAPADAGAKQEDRMLLAASTPLTEEAESLLAQGEQDRALSVAERAIRIHPTDPQLWNLMARIQLERGDAVQAEHLARKSNSLAGNNPTLSAENWMLIAAALKQQGKNDEAQEAMKQANDAERGIR